MEAAVPYRGPEFRPMLDAFMNAFTSCGDSLSDPESNLVLPCFPPTRYIHLLTAVREILTAEPCLLHISSPVVVVGDIHGQIPDLALVLLQFGLPEERRYVFLGDLVDRGDFSLECMTVCFLLKVIFPDDIFLIRGNHEFQAVCDEGGFLTQVIESFGNGAVYQCALNAFAAMPLAGVVDGSIFCVHGGLSPRLTHLRQIAAIERPIMEFGDPMIDGLLWSDPSPTAAGFHASMKRRVGFIFGEKPTRAFLHQNELTLMIRAHECVANGYEELFDGKLITVFTASNYCGVTGNQGAVLEVADASHIKKWQFDPLPWRLRDSRKRAPSMRKLTGSQPLPIARLPSMPPRKAEVSSSLDQFVQRPWNMDSGRASSVILKPKLRKVSF
jgi:protein phosphatase